MKGSDGLRRRTRNLRVKPRERGKVSIRSRLQKFDDEDRVSIRINPASQNIPHPRFNGRTGKVVGSQGRAYFVEVRDGGKSKKVLVTPEHLRRVQ
ncbi:MAG: 50S ribosomal protein L21e [Candidatus Altiarchaeales archaeon]|nr:50S ribosomal protein L21e [Candidatus Altiarchaeales archaeon]MBD3415669.1 50S ribosomal protein L21e [Candidatus Altiarchaeales archaeon]